MDEPENRASNKDQAPQTQNIIAKFGSTIKNVTQIINNQVNEKIIRRLGLEQRIGFILVYGIVFIASILLFFALRSALLPKRPTRMTGEFNIAITEFGKLAPNGIVHESEEGKNLSATLYHRLKKEMESLPTDFVIQVWHNQMDPGEALNVIFEHTPLEREAAAAALADRINANVIIYGNLREGEYGFQFLPEFYVAELPEAGELIGAHQLGSEIAIQGTIDDLGSILQFNEKLSARTKALAHFVIGLAWEATGWPERAIEQFYQAEKLEGWEDQEGKEILYLFIGREAGILWRRGEDRGDEQRLYMEKALALNPEYDRAMIGLGNYHRELADQQYDLVRTLLKEENQNIDSESIVLATSHFHQEANQAVRYYSQAASNSQNSSSSIVEAKMYLSLGGLHNRQGGLLLLLNDYNTAITYFDLAISQVEKALVLIEENNHRYTGLAQLGLAVAYHQKAYTNNILQNKTESRLLYEKALTHYSACINIANEDKFDWFLHDFKEKQCVSGKRDVENALAGFQKE